MTREYDPRKARNLTGWISFVALLVTYWVTTPETVSYWDCPEYVSAAYLLEVGHPPGNPLWMLVERVVTMLAPSQQYAAYAVNLSSGVFTALAGTLLALSLYPVTLWILRRRRVRGIDPTIGAAGTALMAALTFGWCDSTWYSAVEAEVYAMSICFTALTVWLMVQWAFMHDRLRANRYLVLLAYIFGLSLGVHQLNLLVIPALALVWGLRRGIRDVRKLVVIVVLGMIAVGCVLAGMMPGSIVLAADIELLLVNTLGAPPLAGVAVYLLLTGASLILALTVTARSRNRGAIALAIFPAIFMSCLFAVQGQLLVSAAVSAIASLMMVQPGHFDRRRLNLAFWMLAMLMTGYGVYALIPVRGHIPSPANSVMPGEPFAFASYQAREQYGSSPLFYGATPYSKPMFVEEWQPGRKLPVYNRYAMSSGRRIVAPAEPGGRLSHTANDFTTEDSLFNAEAEGRGYLVQGHRLQNIYTPELNSFLPRITSRDERDIAAYGDWVGMDTSNMERVLISEAIDTLGNPVTRYRSDGKRDTVFGYKPTPVQHLKFLGGYQIGYMYLRYLMWNFVGRQNDIPSQGEVEHGNFITGFTPVDNLMLGAQEKLPPEAGSANPGRNTYWGLPLLLGILGVIWLMRNGRRGKATAVTTFLLFVMTGIAIVVYLNQSPGEPRERDYSFLGSFWMFSAWVGFGALWLTQLTRTPWTFVLTLLLPVWMCVDNFDDHDRRGRHAASNNAISVLESLEPDAILFVDGDNHTFPLWYAQEVEGVRRDVRVVNMSYLATSRYAANLMRQWRESEPAPTTLRRGDIIYDAFSRTSLAPDAGDTLPAVEIMRRLRREPTGHRPAIRTRYALLPLAPGDTMVYDMRRLTITGHGGDIRLPQLMMFDIIATNSANGMRRPVYWLSFLSDASVMRLDEKALTPGLFGVRYGTMPDSTALRRLREEIAKVRTPNSLARDVYQDATPAHLTGWVRAQLVKAARRQLSAGLADEARHTLWKADLMMGDTFNSYIFANDGDTIMDVRKTMGELQMALADTMSRRATTPHGMFLVTEMRARGAQNVRRAQKRLRQWEHYRRALPARLRPLVSPIK